jgi:hypothetical protein
MVKNCKTSSGFGGMACAGEISNARLYGYTSVPAVFTG